MPISKRDLGGGITRRIAMTISAPFGDKEIKAFAAAMKRLGDELAGLLRSIDADAGKVLADAGLPSTFDRYWRTAGGTWTVVTDKTTPDLGVHFVWGVWGAAKADGHEHDSKVGFAARAIDQAGWIRHHLARGEAEKACLASVRLGELLTEARMKGIWEPHALRGAKVKAGARLGGPEPGSTLLRDIEMAEEFMEKADEARMSDTALKTRIGKAHGLGRSGAMKAIDRGLEKLSTNPAKVDK